MTAEEKVGQLQQFMGRYAWRKTAGGFEVTEAGRVLLEQRGIGALAIAYALFGALEVQCQVVP
jgi:hypothetical protein